MPSSATRASTGPRHRCRGSQAGIRRGGLSRGCFNGASASLPRIGAICHCVARGARSFNGASASLPRIASCWSTASAAPSSFNGASASLPRIAFCSAPTRRRTTGFNGASASLPRIVLDRRALLPALRQASTGPRHRCRGSARTSRAPRATRARFNGASASLPRIARQTRASRCPANASTGPRHRCRGSQRHHERVPVHVVGASTGPRHRCRGSQLPDGQAAAAFEASTGPRHRCRGSARRPRRRVPRRRGFNGASASLPRIVDSCLEADV